MHRIVQVSDTHLIDPNGRGRKPTVDPAARLRTVLAAVRASGFQPDLVVHSGDVADDRSVRGVRDTHDLLRGLGRALAVPGNHDDPRAVRGEFGVPWTRLGPWQVIGIDTTIMAAIQGEVPHRFLTAVDGVTGPTVLVMHHPVRSHSEHPWFVCGRRDRLIARLEATGQPWVLLSGHTHEPFDEVIGDGGRIRVLGAPAVHYGLHHEGRHWHQVPGTTGARLVTLHDDLRVETEVLYT